MGLNSVGKYDEEQINDSLQGWLMYDAAWKCFKTIFKWRFQESMDINLTALDIGAGAGVMASLFRIFDKRYSVQAHERSPYSILKKDMDGYSYQPYIEGNCEDDYYDTVYSSHVLEHLEYPEKCIAESIRVAKNRIIHIVPDGNVEDKNLGTPHLHTFDRINFNSLIDPFVFKELVKVLDFGVIEDNRLSSLYIVLEKT